MVLIISSDPACPYYQKNSAGDMQTSVAPLHSFLDKVPSTSQCHPWTNAVPSCLLYNHFVLALMNSAVNIFSHLLFSTYIEANSPCHLTLPPSSKGSSCQPRLVCGSIRLAL